MKKGIFRNCEICNKEFYVYPFRIQDKKRGRFCTKKCKYIFLSVSLKGKQPLWLIRKELSLETKNKISAALKGKMPKNFHDMQKKGWLLPRYANSGSFKKGEHISLNTEFKKGQIAPNRGKNIPSIQGKNHYNWKGGTTSETRKQRDSFHKYTTPLIFKRDNYTCQMCKKKGVELQVDHIKSWAKYPKLRFKHENCRTLCKECHYFITFGKPLDDKNKRF